MEDDRSIGVLIVLHIRKASYRLLEIVTAIPSHDGRKTVEYSQRKTLKQYRVVFDFPITAFASGCRGRFEARGESLG